MASLAVDLKLVFVGDVMLGRLVNDALERVSAEYPWGDTTAIFRQADWRACNLECVISDRGTPWGMTPKEFHFRSDGKNVAVLKAAGIARFSASAPPRPANIASRSRKIARSSAASRP